MTLLIRSGNRVTSRRARSNNSRCMAGVTFGNDHDQAGVQFELSHQLAEIARVVGDEYEFFAHDHLSELVILETRPSSPTHMMGLMAGFVCNIREAGMETFVDQEPHP